MVSDYADVNVCWIEIKNDALSEENMAIYESLDDENIIKFNYHMNCVCFGVNGVGKKAQELLLMVANNFVMQDVPEKYAYVSEEQFLIDYCDCFDTVPNPDYKPMVTPYKTGLTGEKLLNYMHEYSLWQMSIDSHEFIKALNQYKVKYPTDQYAKKKRMILDGTKVYLSDFHYQKHLNYSNRSMVLSLQK